MRQRFSGTIHINQKLLTHHPSFLRQEILKKRKQHCIIVQVSCQSLVVVKITYKLYRFVLSRQFSQFLYSPPFQDDLTLIKSNIMYNRASRTPPHRQTSTYSLGTYFKKFYNGTKILLVELLIVTFEQHCS